MSISVYTRLPKAKLAEVVKAAQEIIRDERHWSLVDSADRAGAGANLANMILSLLDEQEPECPAPCGECAAHRSNCNEEGA